MKIRVNIDGYEIEAQEGATILQIARENGIEIPTLCHDARRGLRRLRAMRGGS